MICLLSVFHCLNKMKVLQKPEFSPLVVAVSNTVMEQDSCADMGGNGGAGRAKIAQT